MKRLIFCLILITSTLMPAVFINDQAAAVNIFDRTCGSSNPTGAGTGSTVCKSVKDQQDSINQDPIISIIKGAIGIISYLVGIVAIIGLIVSGIRFITAGGDSNAVTSARRGLVYSLVGIVVVVLAQSIVIFVLGR